MIMFTRHELYEKLALFIFQIIGFLIISYIVKNYFIAMLILMPAILSIIISKKDLTFFRSLMWSTHHKKQAKQYYFNLLVHAVSMDRPDIIRPVIAKYKVQGEQLAQILNHHSEESLTVLVPYWRTLTYQCFIDYGMFYNAGLANLENSYPQMMEDFHKILNSDEIKHQLDNHLFDSFVKTGKTI